MRAPLQALVLLAGVLDVAVLRAPVRRFTAAPVAGREELGGVLVDVLRPPGPGPHPAWVFVSGAHPLRRREPVVQHLVDGLARAGYVVLAPDPPGLAEGEITGATLDATIAAVHGAAGWDAVRDGRIALLGASTGASLALLAAADERVADSISVVVSAVPYADLRQIVRLGTTGSYRSGGALAPYPVTELLRSGVARSVVAALPGTPGREALRGALDSGHLAAVEGLGADERAVAALLANTEPERFDELCAALPPAILAALDRLSPLACAGRVRAPVEIVVPPRDEYFPQGEAAALAAALPSARLTVTRTLDHTRPGTSLRNARGLVRFSSFAVRGLARASR